MIETTLLISAVAAIASIVAAIVSGHYASKSARAQIDVAQINSEKDVLIQREKFNHETAKDRIKELLEKLQEVHETASMISNNYSQTRSYMDWTDNVDRVEFRRLYANDCSRVHRASSIINVYLSEYAEYRGDIAAALSKTHGQMNAFWGSQEGLLRNDDIEDGKMRELQERNCLERIIDASRKIEEHTSFVRQKIVEVAAAVLQVGKR